MSLKTKLRENLAMGVFNTLSLVERTIHGSSLNLLSLAFSKDPHGHFSKVKDRGPLFYSLTLRAWWVTGFDLVKEILRDPRFSNDARHFEKRANQIRKQIGDDQRRLETFENPSMLTLDPPDHTRIRKLATHAFMHKYISSLEPRIERIVSACLDRIGNEPSFDVIDVLAKPLPAIVIAEMMGLPQADHDQFQAWSEEVIEGTFTTDPELIEQSIVSNKALIDYFVGIIEERRGEPGDDLIGQLIAAEEEGDKLNAQELYNTCLLLLVAGHETTTRLIGNGLYWLLKNPDQLQILRDDPEKIPHAVEEMLRYEPPVIATQRYALVDMEFHGKQLKKGDQLFIGFAAANRDPAANDEPDRFDITRTNINQISFGYGIHLCIGASLARLEGKVAFTRLLERFPNIEFGQQPAWGRNPFFRGFDEMWLETTRNSAKQETSAR